MYDQLAKMVQISTHALREEGDVMGLAQSSVRRIFLPTPSARRATTATRRKLTRTANFYPRPPRGGRQTPWYNIITRTEFLPTPSARRATYDTLSGAIHEGVFLPTPSARRATWGNGFGGGVNGVKFLPTPSARRATIPARDFG